MLTERNKKKNPSWWKADQFAIYKHDLGIGQSGTWTRDLRHPNQSATLPPPNTEEDYLLAHHTETSKRMLKAGGCAENEAKIKCEMDKNVNVFNSEQAKNHSLSWKRLYFVQLAVTRFFAGRYCLQNFSQSQKTLSDHMRKKLTLNS